MTERERAEEFVKKLRDDVSLLYDRPDKGWAAVKVSDLIQAVESFSREERARVGELEGALQASRIGLDDWLNQYASELCDEERVKEARERIADNGGTLAYIAQLQDQNRRALQGKEEHGRLRHHH